MAYRIVLAGIVSLSLFGCATPPTQTVKYRSVSMKSGVRAIQQVFRTPGPVVIPNSAGTYGAGQASNIVLTLTREYTTSNILTTYWSLDYQYYNGSSTWEFDQHLIIDFVDDKGVVLVPSAITSKTPSRDCHYGPGVPVHNQNTIDFDFTLIGANLRINPRGDTTGGGFPGEDHRC